MAIHGLDQAFEAVEHLQWASWNDAAADPRKKSAMALVRWRISSWISINCADREATSDAKSATAPWLYVMLSMVECVPSVVSGVGREACQGVRGIGLVLLHQGCGLAQTLASRVPPVIAC